MIDGFSSGVSMMQGEPVDIIVPVYKNVALVSQCLDSLKRHIEEISDYAPRVIVINDSPDCDEVTEYLDQLERDGQIDLLITNKENVGFVKSVNIGIVEARSRGASAILVNSDTVTFKGTLAEMLAVAALDEQIGFVSPRSNNASICTFPQVPHSRSGTTVDPISCHAAWASVAYYLPRYSFAPTAVGFYMYIARAIVDDFDGLDEVFDVGYEEENDLVMRANKVGYRAALANHAFAYHAGSASFLLRDINLTEHRNGNLAKMVERHPEFLPLVSQYQASPKYRAEQIIKNLVPDSKGRLNLVLNLLQMGTVFNGTNELILNIVECLHENAGEAFNITLLVKRSTALFHGFERFERFSCTEEISGSYAIAVSFGQPYDLNTVNVMEVLAPINVYGMLDVISWDCGYLKVEQNIDQLWEHVAETSNGLMYISEYSQRIFERSFAVAAEGRAFGRLLPTKVAAYADRYEGVRTGIRHVLVSGNHFKHKDSMRTVNQLSADMPSLQFVVLGDGQDQGPNVINLRSGTVSDADMIETIAQSSVIVLPSYYEGFGFTIMHALALGKPVVVRDIPVVREIMSTFKNPTGVILFNRNADIPAAVRQAIEVGQSSVDDRHGLDWSGWTKEFAAFLQTLPDNAGVYKLLERRIARGDMMRQIFNLERRIEHAAISSSSVELHPSDRIEMNTSDHLEAHSFDHLESLDAVTFVNYLYEKVLGRQADPAGHHHHMMLLEQGATRRDLIKSILRSDEYTSSGRSVTIYGLEPTRRLNFKRIFRVK